MQITKKHIISIIIVLILSVILRSTHLILAYFGVDEYTIFELHNYLFLIFEDVLLFWLIYVLIPVNNITIKALSLIYLINVPVFEFIMEVIELLGYGGYMLNDNINRLYRLDLPLLIISFIYILYMRGKWDFKRINSDEYDKNKVQLAFRKPDSITHFFFSIFYGQITGKYSIVWRGNETRFKIGHEWIVNTKHHRNNNYKYIDLPFTIEQWTEMSQQIIDENGEYSIIKGYHCASAKIWGFSVRTILRSRLNG